MTGQPKPSEAARPSPEHPVFEGWTEVHSASDFYQGAAGFAFRPDTGQACGTFIIGPHVPKHEDPFFRAVVVGPYSLASVHAKVYTRRPGPVEFSSTSLTFPRGTVFYIQDGSNEEFPERPDFRSMRKSAEDALVTGQAGQTEEED